MSTLVNITNDVISINLSGVGPQGAAGTGVPSGGTSGQVLAKNSSSNYDTLWENPTSVVSSVFGRTGAIVAASNDYAIGQISGAGTAASHNTGDFLQPSSNLSDVSSVTTARANLGLGSAATQNSSAFLQPGNNLSDVGNSSAARTSLGLGGLSTLSLSANNAWTGQQYFSQATLTDASSISWNANTQQSAAVTLGGNRTLVNPSNIQAGGTYTLIVKQDATGSRTLAYGTGFKWPGGTAPTLSTAAGATDILTFLSDGTNLYGVAQKAFA